MTSLARQVPFVDLAAQHAPIREQLDEALRSVLDSGRFVLGPQLTAFEEEFAAYCGAEHCVGVGSGTDALILALRACDIGPGDEVITPSLTFFAGPFAIAAVGAVPVFVDVEEATGTLDVDLARDAITPRTRAILPVHLYGRCADLGRLQPLAAEHELWLIEDAAQAHGARVGSAIAGSVGQLGCFSFYPSKNLGAGGDGGAVVTGDAKLATRLRLLRNYGQREKYRHVTVGTNSRLDELQAAMLRVKLPYLNTWNERRRGAAKTYTDLLGPELNPPILARAAEHVFHLYVVRVARRAALQRFLADHGIGTGIHYPLPVHRQDAFRQIRHIAGSLPVSDKLAGEVLSLPMFPEISPEQISWVVDRLRAGLGSAA